MRVQDEIKVSRKFCNILKCDSERCVYYATKVVQDMEATLSG